MLRGKKRTIELVPSLYDLAVNWPGVAYTCGCAATVILSALALLAMATLGVRETVWAVAVSCAVDIGAHSAVLYAVYERRLFYAPYIVRPWYMHADPNTQLSSVTCTLAIVKTYVLYMYLLSDLSVMIALVNIIATLMLWLVFATTVRSRPAPYVHPYRLRSR